MMRKSRSVFFAAYLPFRCFLRAERPSFNTMFGSMPNSFDAFRSETRSDRIFEITCATESHVSWNFLDREKYRRAVVGTVSRRDLNFGRTPRFRFLRRGFLYVLRFIDSPFLSRWTLEIGSTSMLRRIETPPGTFQCSHLFASMLSREFS
jgi:hypothetical protein